MKKTEMKEVAVFYCDYCGEKIENEKMVLTKFNNEEKHFHDSYDKNCYEEYKYEEEMKN